MNFLERAFMVASCRWERVMTSPRLSGWVGKDIYGFYSAHRPASGGGVRVRRGPDQHPIDGPIEAGTTFRMRQKAPHLGKVRDASVRYTAVKPNRKIEFKARVGPNSPTARLTFERVDGGTRVRFHGEPNPAGPLKVLSSLSTRQGQRIWDKRLARLKRTLEAPRGH